MSILFPKYYKFSATLSELYKTVVLLLTFKNVDNVHNSVHNSFLGHFEVYFC